MGCGASSADVHQLSLQFAQFSSDYERRLKQVELELANEKEINQQLRKTIEIQGRTEGSEETKSEEIIPSPSPQPLGFQPLPEPSHQPTAEEKKSRKIDFDVFLSHKRTDTADFARTLKTELTDLGGLTCFLDQDADFELGDLMTKVRGSNTLLFILSDHILESEWCQLELREAILWGLNIVLITAHGARWKLNGNVHDFPPAQLIRPELQSAFANKAIEYNRNFHKPSMDQLIQRMFGRPVQASIGEWKVPKVIGGTSSQFELDLSTVNGLTLPPENPLQVIHSLVGWHTVEAEEKHFPQFSFGLTQPFHVIQTENEPSKYLLKAEAVVPAPKEVVYAEDEWHPAEPSPDISPHDWSFLVLDGLKHAVQTGTCVVQARESDSKLESSTKPEFEFPVEFASAFPTRPEIFLSATTFAGQGGGFYNRRSFALNPLFIDPKRFVLHLNDLARVQDPVTVDAFQVSWLAFEPRLTRSWTHGIWEFSTKGMWPIPNELNLSKRIFFKTDATSSSGGPFVGRAEFNDPPLVFIGLNGLTVDFGKLVDFSLSVSDITPAGCQLDCHISGLSMDGFKLIVQWLALPNNKSS